VSHVSEMAGGEGEEANGRHPTAPARWQEPMLAQLVKPDDHYRTTSGDWQYERKLDGLRCVAVRNGDQVDLWSRNHLSFSPRFPDVVAALRALPADPFTLDGELVAFEGTRTSFAALQHPGGSSHAVYCVFDLLHLLGRDTTGLMLTERQALATQVIEGSSEVLSPVYRLQGDPAVLYHQACADGWEGLIAKRVSAPYRAGRSGDWQKLKCSASQELVIGGWTDPSGTRVGFGALLVGYYDHEGDFHYAGKVGTGFDHRLLLYLRDQLNVRATTDSPFVDLARLKAAHWVTPDLVANVAFSEWTTDGRLRHPSFQGLRPDKPAASVRRETPV
jgi:bifunctional non-homologous end joining protein LigD